MVICCNCNSLKYTLKTNSESVVVVVVFINANKVRNSVLKWLVRAETNKLKLVEVVSPLERNNKLISQV